MSGLPPLLVVEDSDEDFEILRLSLNAAGAENPVLRCSDAGEVMDAIGRHPEARVRLDRRPALVLLDLNLPGMDGRELLELLRRDDRLGTVPLIVFSTASNPRDIDHCYRAGANGYLVKPLGIESNEAVVKALVDFWLRAAAIPERSEDGIQ